MSYGVFFFLCIFLKSSAVASLELGCVEKEFICNCVWHLWLMSFFASNFEMY